MTTIAEGVRYQVSGRVGRRVPQGTRAKSTNDWRIKTMTFYLGIDRSRVVVRSDLDQVKCLR